jgi:hypothetical protein
MASGGAPPSAGGGGGGGGDNAVINNLINNNGVTSSRAASAHSSRAPRETSPLLGPNDPEGRQRRRQRYLSLMAQLLGAAVLAAALLFGVLAFRRGGRETVPFPEVQHPLKVRGCVCVCVYMCVYVLVCVSAPVVSAPVSVVSASGLRAL